MNQPESDTDDWRLKEISDRATAIYFATTRIESAFIEWEKNQRWQINRIHQEVQSIARSVAFVGIFVVIAAGIYIKRAMNW